MAENSGSVKKLWSRAWIWMVLAWAPAFICLPFFVNIFITPDNQIFPRKIFNGMTIDTSDRKIKASENKDWAESGQTITSYVFKDAQGKMVQAIDGDRNWNVSLFYDFDKDGITDFLVRHWDFKNIRKPQWIALYKYQNDKFVFSRWIPRDELNQSIYLDYKFFGSPYWMIIIYVSAFSFGFGVIVSLVFLTYRWISNRRKRKFTA